MTEWRRVRLKHLAAEPIRNGLGESGAYDDPSWPRYIRTTDIESPRRLRDDTFASLPPDIARKADLRRGDIVMTAAGTIGKSLLYQQDTPACYAGYLVRFRSRPDVDARFVSYWTESHPYWAQIEADRVVSTIENFSASRYQNLELLLPPQSRQRAIADFLDTETARIDDLIAKKRHMVKLLGERRDRELDQAAIPGFDPGHRSDPTDLPKQIELPTEWHPTSIGRCLSRITYGFTNPMPDSDDGPYMLTANDIGEGHVLFETARRTTWDAFNRLLTAKSKPARHDILLTKDGTLGRAALFGGASACVNQSVAVLTPRTDVIRPELLFQLLRVPAYRRALLFNAGGTTIKHLYISRIVKQRIGLPQPGTQGALAAQLAHVHELHHRRTSALGRSIELLAEHRQALITAAVAGTS